jgi:hypothetical protein
MTFNPTYAQNALIRKGAAKEREVQEKLFSILFKVINQIPPSTEQQQSDAVFHAHKLIGDASLRAAAISGALALPPGPLGWLTILPDLASIWRLQAQLVADIGALFGKSGSLTDESMIYCLFRHAAAQAVRDLVTRVGERLVVQRVSLRVTENALATIGVKVAQRIARGGLWRILPALGALLVAGYAYYDTDQVGRTAIEFFSKDVEIR